MSIGGVTRILIIDDDRKTDVLPSPEREISAPGETVERVPDDHPGPSVVRELVARAQELLHRTRRLGATGLAPDQVGTL